MSNININENSGVNPQPAAQAGAGPALASVAANATGNDNGRNVSELNHLTTPLAEARMTINTNPGNFRMPTLPGSLPVF
ncbi:MAG: hypothetical protein ACREHG_11105, partial [Candidatus Saccharimonadales bacterium]